jgi:hypothetical protein
MNPFFGEKEGGFMKRAFLLLQLLLIIISSSAGFAGDNLESPGNLTVIADQRAKGYRVSLHDSPKLQIIVFDGDMAYGNSTKQLKAVTSKLIKGKSVLLFNVHSPRGGYKHSYRNFGDQLKAVCKGYQDCRVITYARMKCNSACIQLIMHGTERWINQKTTFGFHQEWIFDPGFTPTGDNARKELIALGMSAEWFAENKHIFDPKYQTDPLPQNYELLVGSNLYSRVFTGIDDKTLAEYLKAEFDVIIPMTHGFNVVTQVQADFAFDPYYYYSKAFLTGQEPVFRP